jgi:hypothetical protein
LGASSCSSEDAAPPRAISCEEQGDPHCAHPIDRLLVPKLRAIGLGPRDGDALRVCRRLSIDLVGRIPTIDELATCVGESPDQRVDTFMQKPEYVLTQQRAWAEAFGYNSFLMWYGDAYDIDRIVGKLYTGELDYAGFASEIAFHPGFYALHQCDDWTGHLFYTFLGRTARSDEIAGMRPLTRVFESRVFCDAAIWSASYAFELEDGWPDAEAKLYANEGCVAAGSEEFAVNFCGCEPGYGFVGCQSNTLGTPIDFGTDGCANFDDEFNPQNYYRVGEFSPGLRTACKVGSTESACQDKLVDDYEQVAGVLQPYARLEGPMRDRLMGIGRALAARRDFWEAGADRELSRFIGWWKDGVRRPDFDLPEVRALLASELEKTGSVRAIQKLILTSLLYTGNEEPPKGRAADEKLPLWTMGSTKLLTAENWLDSAAIATQGAILGHCDFRFVANGEEGVFSVDPELVRHVPSPLGDLFPEERYRSSAQLLGGCAADTPRPRVSTVGVTYAQHDLSRSLCANAALVLPADFDAADGSDAALARSARHIINHALTREATEAELGELTAEMKECLTAPDGCESPEAAVRWLCTRILDSAEFALY